MTLKPKTTDEKLLELANQDIDMRILAMPHRSTSDDFDRTKYHRRDVDSFSKNTQLEKENEQINAATRESYRSQYLKDANVDFDDAFGKQCTPLFHSL